MYKYIKTTIQTVLSLKILRFFCRNVWGPSAAICILYRLIGNCTLYCTICISTSRTKGFKISLRDSNPFIVPLSLWHLDSSWIKFKIVILIKCQFQRKLMVLQNFCCSQQSESRCLQDFSSK